MKKLSKKGTHHQEAEALQNALEAYESALNSSNTDAVLKLYVPDGVFMAQHSPAVVGASAIRAAYEGIFKAVDLSVELTVEEVELMEPHWAFIRTNSTATVNIHAIGQRVPDANHELFIFQKVDGRDWKIARYCYSTINPPAG